MVKPVLAILDSLNYSSFVKNLRFNHFGANYGIFNKQSTDKVVIYNKCVEAPGLFTLKEQVLAVLAGVVGISILIVIQRYLLRFFARF